MTDNLAAVRMYLVALFLVHRQRCRWVSMVVLLVFRHWSTTPTVCALYGLRREKERAWRTLPAGERKILEEALPRLLLNHSQ